MRAIILTLSLIAGQALAVADPADRLRDPAAEARAETLGRELRCMVCQNQSIEDSDADLARDLRRIVREQITAGRSDSEVMRFVHDRNGDFVLLRRNRAGTGAPPPLTAEEQARLARIEDGGTA